jgi:hypothetical protein
MTKDNDRPKQATEDDIGAPRLTPQGRTGDKHQGGDATDPRGEGVKKGQGDKAEG